MSSIIRSTVRRHRGRIAAAGSVVAAGAAVVAAIAPNSAFALCHRVVVGYTYDMHGYAVPIYRYVGC